MTTNGTFEVYSLDCEMVLISMLNVYTVCTWDFTYIKYTVGEFLGQGWNSGHVTGVFSLLGWLSSARGS